MLFKAFATTSVLLGLILSATTAIRRRQKCTNGTLAIENMQVKFHHTQSTKISADGSITRYLTVNWTLQHADTSKVDGYLIRMRDPVEWKVSKKPFRDADASLTKLWIRTKNITECSNTNEISNFKNGDAMTPSEVHCWCNASTCYFLNGLSCVPSTSQLSSHLGAFYALPNTRKSIMYETKYQTQYNMEFYPYYRQFLSKRSSPLTLEPNWSCAEDLSAISNISITEADRKCCEKGLVTFSPLDVQKSDFMFDPQTTTINISLSWIPPVMETFSGSKITIYSRSMLEDSNAPQHTIIESEGAYNDNNSCSIHNRSDSTTIYNLQPNMSYTININTWHRLGTGRKACKSNGCTKRIEIDTNLCHPDNSKCSDHAYCKYNMTSFTATCECKSGFTGNGKRTQYRNGTGCEPVAISPMPVNRQITNKDNGLTIQTTSQATAIHHNIFLITLITCAIINRVIA